MHCAFIENNAIVTSSYEMSKVFYILGAFCIGTGTSRGGAARMSTIANLGQ
jgi:hypothetical protein